MVAEVADLATGPCSTERLAVPRVRTGLASGTAAVDRIAGKADRGVRAGVVAGQADRAAGRTDSEAALPRTEVVSGNAAQAALEPVAGHRSVRISRARFTPQTAVPRIVVGQATRRAPVAVGRTLAASGTQVAAASRTTLGTGQTAVDALPGRGGAVGAKTTAIAIAVENVYVLYPCVHDDITATGVASPVAAPGRTEQPLGAGVGRAEIDTDAGDAGQLLVTACIGQAGLEQATDTSRRAPDAGQMEEQHGEQDLAHGFVQPIINRGSARGILL